MIDKVLTTFVKLQFDRKDVIPIFIPEREEKVYVELAMEEDSALPGGNVSTNHMEVDLIDQGILNLNELPVVSSHIYFGLGGIPEEDGLFSESIFGFTVQERKEKYAVINLHGKFFHPYVFEVLTEIDKRINEVARGLGSWKITEDGDLEKVSEESELFQEDNTGISWLIENIDKLKVKDSESFTVKMKTNFLNLTRKDWIIEQFLVCPIFYRDYTARGKGKPEVPELNDMYADIIKFSNSLNNDMGFVNNNTMYFIQNKMVEIRKYGQKLCAKKNGFFHKAVLGKNTDYSSRSVISPPVIKNITSIQDMPIDAITSGVPLAQVLGMMQPFIVRWISEYFRTRFEVLGKYIPVYDASGEKVVDRLELDHPMEYFNTDYIAKKINQYIENLETRFEIVKVPVIGKDPQPIRFVGTPKLSGKHKKKELPSAVTDRYLTWCDIFFMAAFHTSIGKHIYITRYPLLDYKGIYPSRIHVMSTIETYPMQIGETFYPYYPVINLNTSRDDMNSIFHDAITMSNLHLVDLVGDYDGDTVSSRVVFSKEANEEAEEIMHSPKHYLTLKGDISKQIEKEVILNWFCVSIY